MSLKSDYYDGVTGLLQQCDTAFVSGQSFITSNLTAISDDLKSQASQGITKFTLTYTTTYNPSILRGNKANNLILKSYLAGIQDGLASQAIYDFEVTPSLNVADSVITGIDVNYAPNGFSTYELAQSPDVSYGGTGMPVAIRLSLSFKETEYLVKGSPLLTTG